MTDLEQALERAASAAAALSRIAPRLRAAALVAAADALDARADELIPVAMRETGLAEPRLRGELRRTTVQLRLFAEVVVDGSYLDVRIDEADPDFVLGPRPDLRRVMEPVGPVLNFAASNFPFAFSVAGGDTAAALAAGCPVVVKAHPGHPELSRRVADAVAAALESAGMPVGTLQLIEGQEDGVTALLDPRVSAAAFTGSTTAGVHLASLAASRPVPIPFYGELGSVNPVFVTPSAAGEADSLAAAFVASVSGSAGQLCTKPGFLFVPEGAGLDAAISRAVSDVPEHRLLHPGIAAGYRARRDAILGAGGVSVIAEGAIRETDDGTYATPTIVRTSLRTLIEERDALLDEAFGPLSIVVEYPDPAALASVARDLFPGNLTATVHLAEGDPEASLPALIDALARTSGRVLVGGWPTGVAVTPAMEHGGPFPATTQGGTSVGTAAIGRFLRGVAYQGVPAALLPPSLRDDNPWRIPQRRTPRGASAAWGTLTGVGTSEVLPETTGVEA
ncbi:aldehyde dehydrogenase (NADP(+)) [Microbacterium paludicola]|uniref:Aldehyde dehydrogenase (NADP(+)) n=1 Tax=Microbacterium paludicola TaxID=300019 RepID=A0A4Y9FUU2_9MICO|nr:aldehyde dehydrogenase (NADP(+)) [Microbacterium paludicola]MBF0817282.1 aldehyde dehydrogenase (NADP(+)) [Microbacterium paludicola]TFU31989.1 aldehyde dehydrogenase (NADP(+)) [Microbacterium paludicola]